MTTVPASEFQKNFGHFKEVAQREPVKVTSNGRDSVVLISATEFAEYEAFKQSSYAFQGQVTEEFANDLDQFMSEHSRVLTELAK